VKEHKEGPGREFVAFSLPRGERMRCGVFLFSIYYFLFTIFVSAVGNTSPLGALSGIVRTTLCMMAWTARPDGF
jgi:hypothetical protein